MKLLRKALDFNVKCWNLDKMKRESNFGQREARHMIKNVRYFRSRNLYTRKMR